MKYRNFKGLNKPVSLLGLGCMRFPVLDGKDDAVDEAAAIALIRRAIDAGVNYIDTAYMYHGGKSEGVVGKALKDGYREKVFLADKMPVWFAKDGTTMEDIFQEQLDRLQVDHIDLYLAHNLNQKFWDMGKEKGLLPFLEKKKKEGAVGLVGFSFHDELPLFKEIADSYEWDFCQIQLNYMDASYQAGVEGLQYAAEKGLPVIIMEPLKGGRLTANIPEAVQKCWDRWPGQRLLAEWGFRWVANFNEVSLILSGLSDMEQLTENLRIFDSLTPACMTKEELQVIEEAAEEYRKRIRYACTGCRYCTGCPKEIDIPLMVEIYNGGCQFGRRSVQGDISIVQKTKRPDQCTHCGICEEKCPQGFPIRTIMDELVKMNCGE